MDTDWLSVLGNSVGTLLATIVGAVVALFGARALHERESKARYEEGLDEGIGMLVEVAALHRRAAADWRARHKRSGWISRPLNSPPPAVAPDPAPTLDRFVALLDLVTLRAKGHDRSVLHAASFTAEVLFPEDSHDEKSSYRAIELAQTLLLWRVTGAGAMEVIGEMEAMAEGWVREDEEAHKAERDAAEGDEQ